jgi:drug/metabolite transporter (DMT)-like permease
VLAFAAGLGFGGFFVFADATSEASGLWPLVAARVLGVGLLVLLLIARARQTPLVPRDRVRSTVGLVVGAGLFDQAANVLFLLATREGSLTVVGVVISLYPVVVVALAAVVLHERLGPRFAVAAAAALLGSGLIAGAS